MSSDSVLPEAIQAGLPSLGNALKDFGRDDSSPDTGTVILARTSRLLYTIVSGGLSASCWIMAKTNSRAY